MKKSNIFSFVIGILLASSIGVYAATTLSSSSVYYDNSTSGSTASTVSGALDELYEKTDDITKYAFGNPTNTDVTVYNDYMDLVNSGKKVFISLNDGDKKICLFINGGLMCFENIKEKMSDVWQVADAYAAINTTNPCNGSGSQYSFYMTCANSTGAGESCYVSGSQTANTPTSISCTDSEGNKCTLGTDDSVTCE